MVLRLVVTGRSGQVAAALARLAAADQTLDVVTLGRPEMDLLRPETIAPAIAAARPDVVVNAAAYTAVDRAESEGHLAFAVNAAGAGAVAEAAARLGIPVIQVSTDYVFDGAKATPYVESDATAPLSVYGASKLAGEKAVAAANPRHVILRTSWVYSAGGANFLRLDAAACPRNASNCASSTTNTAAPPMQAMSPAGSSPLPRALAQRRGCHRHLPHDGRRRDDMVRLCQGDPCGKRPPGRPIGSGRTDHHGPIPDARGAAEEFAPRLQQDRRRLWHPFARLAGAGGSLRRSRARR